MKSILPDTKPLKASPTMRQYEKNGDFQTAKNDFYSFKPKSVRDRNSNTRLNSWNHRPMVRHYENISVLMKRDSIPDYSRDFTLDIDISPL